VLPIDPSLALGIVQTFLSILQIKITLSHPAAYTEQTIVVFNEIRDALSGSQVGNASAVIEERVKAELPPEVASSVLADISALAMMAQPPRIEAFDYWSLLLELTRSARDFCHRSNIFRLRGIGMTVGDRLLKMPKTTGALFDVATQQSWVQMRFAGAGRPGPTIDTELYLVEGGGFTPRLPYPHVAQPNGFLPLVGNTKATYWEYGHGGYGGQPPREHEVLDVFTLVGADLHWLMFISDRDEQTCKIRWQRMLTGPEVQKIVESLQQDVSAYVVELLGDQQFSEASLRPSFAELLAELRARG
jgi:hypothetical protein